MKVSDFFLSLLRHHSWTFSNRRKQESHCEKLWQLRLWWEGWLSLGSGHHSPHHWCGLWAGDNATLTRTVPFFQEKQTVGSTAASKTCHLPHPQRGDIQVFLYFLLLLQKKAVNPYVLKWDWLYTNTKMCCLGEQRSPSPIWRDGAAENSGHSSTLSNNFSYFCCCPWWSKLFPKITRSQGPQDQLRREEDLSPFRMLKMETNTTQALC